MAARARQRMRKRPLFMSLIVILPHGKKEEVPECSDPTGILVFVAVERITCKA
jgi:hypothetical protein